MKKVITSESGKKQAEIFEKTTSGYRVAIWQIVNTGIGIERDYVRDKTFRSSLAAKDWAIKMIK